MMVKLKMGSFVSKKETSTTEKWADDLLKSVTDDVRKDGDDREFEKRFHERTIERLNLIEEKPLKELISTLPQGEVYRCGSDSIRHDQEFCKSIALSENVGFQVANLDDIRKALEMEMPETLTVDYLVKLHHVACHSVDDKSGKLRENIGMTFTHIFPNPAKLQRLMKTLVDEYNQTPVESRSSVHFASMFVMKLLQIHPYEYANGITARIVFIKMTKLPIALDMDYREYVQCLVRKDTVGFYKYCLKCCNQ